MCIHSVPLLRAVSGCLQICAITTMVSVQLCCLRIQKHSTPAKVCTYRGGNSTLLMLLCTISLKQLPPAMSTTRTHTRLCTLMQARCPCSCSNFEAAISQHCLHVHCCFFRNSCTTCACMHAQHHSSALYYKQCATKAIRYYNTCIYLKKHVPVVELLRAELSILTGPVLLLLAVSRLLLAIACAIAVSSSCPPCHQHKHDQCKK
jgi:hypothetical protein